MTDRTNTDHHEDDIVKPFRIENTDIRGQIIRVGDSLDTLLAHHTLPQPVQRLMAEGAMLAAMLGAAIKFDGKIILQARGDGPVPLLVADYATDGSFRAYAQVEHEVAVQPSAGAPPTAALPLAALMGTGHLAITIDQGLDMDRYQGIVELAPDSLAASTLSYFARSEQTLTAIRLAIAPPAGDVKIGDGWRGGAIMIQRLPEDGQGIQFVSHKTLDAWERASALLQTVSDDELTDADLEADRLLYRLFHEEGVRTFTPKPLRFGCACNRERIEKLLQTFGYSEVQDLMEDGKVTVKCEFCGTEYAFDHIDLMKIGLGPADLM